MNYIGEIIVAILALVGTIVGSMTANNKTQAVMQTQLDLYKEQQKDQIDGVKEDIKELKKSQDKHNQVVERLAIVERDNKTAFNRIDELRQDINELRKGK